METPKETHLGFLVLSALLDRNAKRASDIASTIEWQKGNPHIYSALDKLHRNGLVLKQRGVVRAGDGQTVEGTVYQITESGIRTWNETVDWYAHIALKFGETAGPVACDVLAAESVPRTSANGSRRFRLPTAGEDARIIEASSAGFAVIYRAVRSSPLTREQLTTLQIGDVDLAAGTVRVRHAGNRSRSVRIDETFRAILRDAMAERTSGPAFVTRAGTAWTRDQLTGSFRRARERAGLPAEIKLCGSGRGKPVGARDVA